MVLKAFKNVGLDARIVARHLKIPEQHVKMWIIGKKELNYSELFSIYEFLGQDTRDFAQFYTIKSKKKG